MKGSPQEIDILQHCGLFTNYRNDACDFAYSPEDRQFCQARICELNAELNASVDI